MEQSISKKISVFKWILTLGIVAYHARWIYGYSITYTSTVDQWLLNGYVDFANHLGFVSMTFFFFTSGFFFYNRLENMSGLKKKIKSRVNSLIVPFVLWNIALICYFSMKGEVELSLYNLCDYFFFEPLAGPLWYLLALFLLILVAPVFVYFKEKKKINTILFLILITVCLLRLSGYIPTIMSYKRWWWYPNIISYLPFYLVGAYLGMYYPKLVLDNTYADKKFSYIGLVLIVISFLLWNLHNSESMYAYYSFIELVGLWLLVKADWFTKETPKVFSCSFYIYALHNQVLIPLYREYSQRILYSLDISVSGAQMILVKIIELFTIVIICLGLKFLAKIIFSDKIYYGLTGGR